MEINLLTKLTTYVVFGLLGYLLGQKIQVPTKTSTWVLWLILLVLSDSLFVSTRLVDIFGFIIYFQWVLQALVVGILLNFIVRASRSEKKPESSSGAVKS